MMRLDGVERPRRAKIWAWKDMGVIINPRGTSGSGKTELARRILSAYGWRAGITGNELRRAGRGRPIGYRLQHPRTGKQLVVIGAYEETRGGCDTIPLADGGLEEAFRLAAAWAAAGCDVVLEGAAVSLEHELCAALAVSHPLHVIMLETPPRIAARRLIRRRHVPVSLWDDVTCYLQVQHAEVEAACKRLTPVAASVERLNPDSALGAALRHLGAMSPGRTNRDHRSSRAAVGAVRDHADAIPCPAPLVWRPSRRTNEAGDATHTMGSCIATGTATQDR